MRLIVQSQRPAAGPKWTESNVSAGAAHDVSKTYLYNSSAKLFALFGKCKQASSKLGVARI